MSVNERIGQQAVTVFVRRRHDGMDELFAVKLEHGRNQQAFQQSRIFHLVIIETLLASPVNGSAFLGAHVDHMEPASISAGCAHDRRLTIETWSLEQLGRHEDLHFGNRGGIEIDETGDERTGIRDGPGG